jgi:UDP-N-acetylmuramoyl-tripeptide--D-alanyl-D-alanine ligase
LVTELGARRAGEIADLCAFVQPHIGVITGVGSTHLEVFGSRRVIAQTKSELLSALPPDGVAIVPSNDDFLDVFSETTSAKLRTVGPGAAIRYRALGIDGEGHTHGAVEVDGEALPVRLALPNRALMRNAAMAIAVGIELGIDPKESSAALAVASLSAARMQILDIGDWTIANDAYNANPTSTAAALRSVRELAGDREAWAVLGPMAELGPQSVEGHKRIGRLVRSLGYRGVITVGSEASAIADSAGGIAHRVESVDDAAGAAIDLIPPGSVVLIKASRIAGLDLLPGELARRLESVQREA